MMLAGATKNRGFVHNDQRICGHGACRYVAARRAGVGRLWWQLDEPWGKGPSRSPHQDVGGHGFADGGASPRAGGGH